MGGILRRAAGILLILGAAGASAAESRLRPVIGQNGWGWIEDSVKLGKRLEVAAGLGYNAFIYQFDPPPLRRHDGYNWIRSPATGFRWKLSDGRIPGGVDARGELVERLRRVKRITEAAGMEFIPHVEAMGWGGALPDIDPATLGGVYYELEIPGKPENLFLPDSHTAVAPSDGWGDRGGRFTLDDGTAKDLSRFHVALAGKGMYAANFLLRPSWDGYLRWRVPVKASGGAADSACLKAYEFNGWEFHPYSTRPAGGGGSRLSGGETVLEAAFYVRKGRTYFLNLEYHGGLRRGGTLSADRSALARSIPPRDHLIDISGYEKRMPGSGDSPRSHNAAHGYPDEASMRTLIGARAPRLSDADFFELPLGRADSAWASMTAFRGTFRDFAPDAFRKAVDPLAPATREIVDETLDALAEALGAPPKHFHLGGDEVFSLGRSRRQSRPVQASSDRATLYALLVRTRLAQVEAAIAQRFPGAREKPAYLLYGDMVTLMNGAMEGTLGALRLLSGDSLGPHRLVVMPWYYESHVNGIPNLRIGEAGTRMYTFREILSRDFRALSDAGIDFVGIYSTDGSGRSLKQGIRGAEEWNRLCEEFAGTAGGRGRCLGVGYCGWDAMPAKEWSRQYNGLLMLAAGWAAPSPANTANTAKAWKPIRKEDRNGNGVMDDLESRLRD